jgi:hypothetical protein
MKECAYTNLHAQGCVALFLICWGKVPFILRGRSKDRRSNSQVWLELPMREVLALQ